MNKSPKSLYHPIERPVEGTPVLHIPEITTTQPPTEEELRNYGSFIKWIQEGPLND